MTPPSARLAALVAASLLAAACSGGGNGATDGDTSPPITDTTAPFTTATPGGGLYAEPQLVTLSASEPAIIYYTTDGNPPSVGGATTTAAASPVTNLLLANPTTLRYFAVDAAGNEEFPKQDVYDFDFDPPGLFLSDFLTGTYGFLEVLDVTFSSDEFVNYLVEVGGDGTPGDGLFVASGQAQPFVVQHVDLPGWMLPIGAQNPGASVWLHVSDAAQGLTSYEFDVDTLPADALPLPGLTTQLELSADGSRLYALDGDAATLRVVDTDPQSASFHSVLAELPLGANPTGFDLTDDGGRLYVTNDGGFTEVDLGAFTTLAIDMPGGRTPSGIAIHRKGRGLCAADDGTFWELDVSPGSGFYQMASAVALDVPLMTSAEIALSPDRSKAVVAWQGDGAYGVCTTNTNPESLLFLQFLPTLLEGPAPALVGSPAVNAASTRAWLGNLQGNLTRVDLTVSPPQVLNSSASLTVTGVTPVPDESVLFLTGGPLLGIRVVDPTTLVERAFVPAGGVANAGTSRDVRFTPDGQRAYLVRDNGAPTAELWVLDLTSQ